MNRVRSINERNGMRDEGVKKWRRKEDLPVNPIKLYTVIRWALSATYLPRMTILSHKGASAYFAANLAALNLATFCAGVSANFCGEEEVELCDGF